MPLFQSESKCETILDLHENETACRTHFHMKGFALRLALKQRHKRTRKWPIILFGAHCFGHWVEALAGWILVKGRFQRQRKRREF